ncbi:MAG: acyl-CoA thioesterase [Specibacter sp.]
MMNSPQEQTVQEKFDDDRRLTLQVPMRWGDMDAYGHINNVEVLRILEEARVHAFGPPAGTGLPGIDVALPIFSELDADVQALVVEHRVKYLSPLNYRNIAATVQVWVSAVKGASFTVAYGIFDPVTDVKCVIAETVLAFFHEPSGTLVRLSAEKKAQLEPLRGPANFKA